MHYVGVAKLHIGALAEAAAWLRRCLDANRNHPLAHFHLAAAVAQLGELEEAHATVQEGLALNPTCTIRRMRASVSSDNPIFLAGRERNFAAMRMVGVPEG